MSDTHRIMLRGRWEYTRLMPAVNEPAPASGTVQMPRSWQDLLGDWRGCVRFSRKFHWVTPLTGERIRLEFVGVADRAQVTLNGERLGDLECSDRRQSFDVTERLQRANLLEVDVTFEQPSLSAAEGSAASAVHGGLYGPVCLHIA